jgi:hypothetical protein
MSAGLTAALVADGAGSLDQSVTSLLAVVAFAAGWVAVRRLLGKGFPRVPRPAAWGSGAVAVACVALIFILPPILTPAPASTRPSFTSTNLTPDEGHVHLFVDGRLVSMSYGLDANVWIAPGTHTLLAAFVAVDHAPFNPPVQASVPFRVTG